MLHSEKVNLQTLLRSKMTEIKWKMLKTVKIKKYESKNSTKGKCCSITNSIEGKQSLLQRPNIKSKINQASCFYG
jgi:hypothetical protein